MSVEFYKDDFGIERVIGKGEGVEKLNRSDEIKEFGYTQAIVVPFNLEDGVELPKVNLGTVFGRGICKLPKGSVPTKAGVVIKEISGGTASFGVGLYKKDGTAVNAVGLVAAAAKTAGAVAGDGALLNTVLADDSYISVSSDTVSATKLRGFIYVEYV